MSQFQAQNIPESMLHSYDNDVTASDKDDGDGVDTGTESDVESEREDFENDMDALRGYSLVTLSAAGLCEMHSLVQLRAPIEQTVLLRPACSRFQQYGPVV
jgi:hypothetical protein